MLNAFGHLLNTRASLSPVLVGLRHFRASAGSSTTPFVFILEPFPGPTHVTAGGPDTALFMLRLEVRTSNYNLWAQPATEITNQRTLSVHIN